jgi:hypothetical protein
MSILTSNKKKSFMSTKTSDPAGAGQIRETRLADALSERYLAYAMSTIMSRSLPDVRDGLKSLSEPSGQWGGRDCGRYGDQHSAA